LILDEVILYHSFAARAYNEQIKRDNPKGILEKIYQRVGSTEIPQGIKFPTTVTQDTDTSCNSSN